MLGAVHSSRLSRLVMEHTFLTNDVYNSYKLQGYKHLAESRPTLRSSGTRAALRNVKHSGDSGEDMSRDGDGDEGSDGGIDRPWDRSTNIYRDRDTGTD